MNLEQIKNEVCKKHSMQNYTEFVFTCQDTATFDKVFNDILNESILNTLKNISEQIKNEIPINDIHFYMINNVIFNEKNIIK